jgi:UDP-N-acetyl-D-glucosamine dehydrogenase
LFKSNKSMNKKILGNLVVVGLGYVGLPLALLADRKNWDVTGVDNNPDKIEKINNKIAPFADEKISAELKTSTLKATSDKSVVKNADIIILCVPTPVYEDHMPNLEPVISACEGIAPFLTKGQLVILESTVNPGVCEEIVIPILEKNTALKAGEDFYVAHCPERIDPGNTNWDVETIPRVVGSLEKIGLTKAMDFYGSILISKVKPMNNLKEAEAVKIIENVFRDINIAFVNELAMSFQRLGIDVVNVIEGAGTKPFAFMPHFPGCGVGGHCIPVDPYYLIDYAKKNGFRHEFLSLARKINSDMPKYAVDLLVANLQKINCNLAGTKVAVLGLAYKPNIDDDRESPSYKIIKVLQDLGAEVVAYDPFVKKSTVANLEEALSGTEAVIIATAHTEFRDMQPADFINAGVKIIIDGRNCLNKDIFINSDLLYQGIGR